MTNMDFTKTKSRIRRLLLVWALVYMLLCAFAPLRLCVRCAEPSHPSPGTIIERPEPFPVPAGSPAAEQLYRQTNEDVLRKSWGCANCHQGVRDMHDLPTVK